MVQDLTVNLANSSVAELEQLSEEIKNAIEARKIKEINDARIHVRELAESLGITLEELIKFELLLEIDTLDNKFNDIWAPLGFKIEDEEFLLFEKVEYNELFDVLSLWQQAFEWNFYDAVLSNVQNVK